MHSTGQIPEQGLRARARLPQTMFVVLVVMLGLVGVPMGFTSKRISNELAAENCLKEYIEPWAEENNLKATIIVVNTIGRTLEANVVLRGPPWTPSVIPSGYPAYPTYVQEIAEGCPDVALISTSFLSTTTYEL